MYIHFRIHILKLPFMFVHLLMNYVILTLRNVKY